MPATVIHPSRRTTGLGRSPSQPARPEWTPNANSTAPWGHSGTRRLRNISPSSGQTNQARNELTAIVTMATPRATGRNGPGDAAAGCTRSHAANTTEKTRSAAANHITESSVVPK